MQRREFLVAAAQTGLGAGLAATTRAFTLPELNMPIPRETYPPKPRYFAWTEINTDSSSSGLKAKYAKYKKNGLTGVFLGGGINQREFDAVKEAGLELHCWMWTVNRGDQWIRDHHPDWYQVSRSGKSCFDQPPYVEYYRWVSPVIPGVQSYLKEKVAELASHSHTDGVHLDYVRYPDVILPRGLWAKYGLDQTEELPDYDFCYSPHTRKAFEAVSGRDPLKIKNPSSDQEWLHFRYDSVTKLVRQLAGVAHGYGKKITAAVFPSPRLARKICRQDWDKWPLDFACPMIYNSFYLQSVDWVGETVLEDIQTATFPICAGLYMPALSKVEDFTEALKVSKRRGAVGVSLFGDVSDAHWEAFEGNRW